MPEADVRLDHVSKRFGDFVAVDELSLDIPRGRVLLAARPIGLRQDDHPADDRRLRGGHRGHDLPRRHRRDRPPAVQARDEHRLPELRAVPAPQRLREHRLRPAPAEDADERDPPPGRRSCSSSSSCRATRSGKPSQLSGGQQQRIALARALVNNPQVLLLDEPLGALDLKLRKQMQVELKRIQSEIGITFIFVTHDQEEAMTMSDRIAVMRQGRIEQLGAPGGALRAAGDRVRGGLPGCQQPARRRGRRRAAIASPSCAWPTARCSARPTVGAERRDAVRLGVRPEKLRVIAIGDDAARRGRRVNAIEGTVLDASYIGVSTQYLVETADGHKLTVYAQNLETSGAAEVLADGAARPPHLEAAAHVRHRSGCRTGCPRGTRELEESRPMRDAIRHRACHRPRVQAGQPDDAGAASCGRPAAAP